VRQRLQILLGWHHDDLHNFVQSEGRALSNRNNEPFEIIGLPLIAVPPIRDVCYPVAAGDKPDIDRKARFGSV
jgi:hypothetical protein